MRFLESGKGSRLIPSLTFHGWFELATLVTGGTGFVGANIVKDLAANGHEVICHDIAPPDALIRSFLEPHGGQVSFVTSDILDRTSLEELLDGPVIDKVVHAAVFTVNRMALERARSRDILDINIIGTTNLLELARLAVVERFIYVSSGAAYGMARSPDQTFNEDDHAQPENLYSISKLASEAMTRRYGQLHGFTAASLRLSTPYGPMERVTGHRDNMSLPYQWTGRLLRGEPIPFDPTAAGRDFTYAADTASGVRAALDSPEVPHDLYNVTTGLWITPAQFLEQLQALYPEVEVVEAPASGPRPIGAEPSRGPMSGQRFWRDFGWEPQYDLAAGLTDYMEWRRSAEFFD